MLIEEKELVITNVVSNKEFAAAFAWTEEQEDVFISRDVMESFGKDVIEGDVVIGVIIPNKWGHREKTPFKCIRISSMVSLTSEPEVTTPLLRDVIYNYMCEREDEFFSVEDMSHQEIYEDHPRTGRQEVRVALDSLHNSGHVCKAAVFNKMNHGDKATINLYSKEMVAFEWGDH